MRSITTKAVIAALTCCCTLHSASAQDGAMDLTFNATDIGFENGDGTSGIVYGCAVQPDGKAVMVGDFQRYNGKQVGRVTRVNTNGKVDNTFNSLGAGASGTIRALALQPDGKVLIAGSFTSYNGIAVPNIARLNTDGSLDGSFAPAPGPNSTITCMALQPDGRILIAGPFTTYDGFLMVRIARVLTNGTVDFSFSGGTGPNVGINTIALQPDNKIIVGGTFTSFSGTQRNRIARLNASGSIDTGFFPGTGMNATVNCALPLADGTIMVGGDFTTCNGVARARIARLTASGALDTGFAPGTGANGTVITFAQRSDGKVFIGGSFDTYGGLAGDHLVLLNANGTTDLSFGAGETISHNVMSIAFQSDGKLIVGGAFENWTSMSRRGLLRLEANGGFDNSYNIGTGVKGGEGVRAIALQPDGKILIGGIFQGYNGGEANTLARLTANGELDGSFSAGTGTNGIIYKMAVQPDGKILVAGSFTRYNGTTTGALFRLNVNGSLDGSFVRDTLQTGFLRTVILQPDGKILIGGHFSTFHGAPRNDIARLNTDGSLDATFNPGTGTGPAISEVQLFAIALQPDGRIVIAGHFTNYNGTACGHIARLNANGSLDVTFDPGTGVAHQSVTPYVRDLALQPDGKIVLVGLFTSFNGMQWHVLARVNSNGSLDTGFVATNWGPNNDVERVALQPDGRILLAGNFTTYDAVSRLRFTRIKRDGTLDPDLYPGTAMNDAVYAMAVQPDGKILVGGLFTGYNGTGRNRIARINGTSRVSSRVLLEGPYNAGLMNDALRTLPSFPITDPYAAMGYNESGHDAGAPIGPHMLAVTGNDAIVDWVIAEMRPVASPATVAASRTVLLQRDGDVVDLDGVSTVGFGGLAAGNYCLAVKPRNHLPVMLSPTTPISYGSAIATVDFTLPATQVYVSDARKNVGGVMVVVVGDVTFNETVQYTGAGNDRDPILTRIGGVIPTNTVSGYWREDVNLDGVVKYTGAANDCDLILQSIGGTVLTNTRVAGLP